MNGCQISTDWTYRGMRTLSIENEFLKITCLVDSGARIIEFKYKPTERNFLWQRPHFRHKASTRSPGLTINVFDYWGGGWDELFQLTALRLSRSKVDISIQA